MAFNLFPLEVVILMGLRSVRGADEVGGGITGEGHNPVWSASVPTDIRLLTFFSPSSQLWCMNSQSHLETRPDHACGPLTEKGSADSSFLVRL